MAFELVSVKVHFTVLLKIVHLNLSTIQVDFDRLSCNTGQIHYSLTEQFYCIAV